MGVNTRDAAACRTQAALQDEWRSPTAVGERSNCRHKRTRRGRMQNLIPPPPPPSPFISHPAGSASTVLHTSPGDQAMAAAAPVCQPCVLLTTARCVPNAAVKGSDSCTSTTGAACMPAGGGAAATACCSSCCCCTAVAALLACVHVPPSRGACQPGPARRPHQQPVAVSHRWADEATAAPNRRAPAARRFLRQSQAQPGGPAQAPSMVRAASGGVAC